MITVVVAHWKSQLALTADIFVF